MALFARMLWFSGSIEEVEEACVGHAEQLQRLSDEGRLHFAGTFGDDDGYFEVIDVADRHEAERITRASPLVEAGLTSWTLRVWLDRVEPT